MVLAALPLSTSWPTLAFRFGVQALFCDWLGLLHSAGSLRDRESQIVSDKNKRRIVAHGVGEARMLWIMLCSKLGTDFGKVFVWFQHFFVKKEEAGEMKALQVQASKGLLSLEELPKPEVGSPPQKKPNAGRILLFLWWLIYIFNFELIAKFWVLHFL